MRYDYIPDYNEICDRHDAKEQAKLDNLPKCVYCDEAITSEYLFDLDGDITCESCLVLRYRKKAYLYYED